MFQVLIVLFQGSTQKPSQLTLGIQGPTSHTLSLHESSHILEHRISISRGGVNHANNELSDHWARSTGQAIEV